MSVTATGHAESPSQAVVEAVAEREGVDPTDLTVPLYDAVDPEALDAVVQEALKYDDPSFRIEFRYYGYTISVSADGSVEVSETA
ncbi:hypothetical protein GRS48_08285 [Halorubrum sp. JWXQ-INN 858]|uniref:HalOD1 output domain-containing protein n=1 Tax=Halorubrum sp. JWXQ-INN 858 TaxID=2690782 RepID=UPI001358DE54|nr:HalOD1 output domain-containing protein [Halorubrum sp. JWXQ-INN 858]MWV64819.1 hypothetical protein [Halorubrum sp. JWXQ-INN 858]